MTVRTWHHPCLDKQGSCQELVVRHVRIEPGPEVPRFQKVLDPPPHPPFWDDPVARHLNPIPDTRYLFFPDSTYQVLVPPPTRFKDTAGVGKLFYIFPLFALFSVKGGVTLYSTERTIPGY